jgi:23S rRNA (cytosine1962-C5)-methyltransferase
MSKANPIPIRLKPGREKSLLRHHPWVFDGAIAHVSGQPQVGEIVSLYSAQGQMLGLGGFSPQSQIRVRMWTFDSSSEINASRIHQRLEQAIATRHHFLSDPTQTACRLVAAESDGLPGLIVDRYADVLVCQFLAASAEWWRSTIVHSLQTLFPGARLYERSDVDVREKEGLPLQMGVLHGTEPPDCFIIRENAVQYWVDVRNGHKTGFYLDQRENRAIVGELAAGKRVLNCFSYTGGFSLAALQGGATHVMNIDSSATMLQLSEKNHDLNHFADDRYQHSAGDVFRVLRQLRDQGQQFDLIVLDPPKFVESQSQLPKAARGYKDINRLAFLLLRPHGLLVTFSCSGLLSAELFQKIVADAALDAHREAQIIRRLGQATDHPTLLSFPEGFYLKGLVCLVT